MRPFLFWVLGVGWFGWFVSVLHCAVPDTTLLPSRGFQESACIQSTALTRQPTWPLHPRHLSPWRPAQLPGWRAQVSRMKLQNLGLNRTAVPKQQTDPWPITHRWDELTHKEKQVPCSQNCYLKMYLWSLSRTGTNPRKNKPQYSEKWNHDSCQDNGIDLIHLCKRLEA